jgi:hypothetical protein
VIAGRARRDDDHEVAKLRDHRREPCPPCHFRPHDRWRVRKVVFQGAQVSEATLTPAARGLATQVLTGGFWVLRLSRLLGWIDLLLAAGLAATGIVMLVTSHHAEGLVVGVLGIISSGLFLFAGMVRAVSPATSRPTTTTRSRTGSNTTAGTRPADPTPHTHRPATTARPGWPRPASRASSGKNAAPCFFRVNRHGGNVILHHRHIQPVLIRDWSPRMDGIAATIWASKTTDHPGKWTPARPAAPPIHPPGTQDADIT